MGKTTPMGEPCASCDMRCCSHFAIPLTCFDVARISTGSGLAPGEFCALVDAKRIEAPMHSHVFIFGKDGKLAEKSLVLGKEDDGACSFFRKGEGCQIHGFHPLACKAYPFVFGLFGKLQENRHFICPRKWRTGEYDEAGAKKCLEEVEREIAIHNSRVRKWNATISMTVKASEAEGKFFEYILAAAKEKSGR